MIEIIDSAKCCGCGACKNICPVSAISMQADKKGFLYPHIDEGKCINCGKCLKVCPIQSKITTEVKDRQEVYAVRPKDEELLRKSTSGGAFSLLADPILEKGGVCFGATLDDNLYIKHVSINDKSNLDLLRGSKYVQSDTLQTFTEVANCLLDGKEVLYSGTPCQVDGLQRFLEEKKVDQSKLLTVDLLCHGVPSPKVWKDFTEYLSKKYKRKLKTFYFRTKHAGWENSIETAVFENGKKKRNTQAIRVFLNLFYKNASLRPYCYKCQYSSYDRKSDITIGDFWGVEKVFPEMNDNKGVSLVLVNTEKGKRFFVDVKNNANIKQTSKDRCKQRALLFPAKAKVNIEKFWKDYDEKGFEYIANTYAKRSFASLVKVKLITFLYKVRLLKFFRRFLGR